VRETEPVRCEHAPDVPLREYIERIFDERQKALDVAFKSQEQALALASRNLELRLEKLNELRQEVTQDRGNFLTRDKYESEHGALGDRVTGLEAFRGRALGFGALIALISGVAGAIVQRALGG
jgi:hypothetical protein